MHDQESMLAPAAPLELRTVPGEMAVASGDAPLDLRMVRRRLDTLNDIRMTGEFDPSEQLEYDRLCLVERSLLD